MISLTFSPIILSRTPSLGSFIAGASLLITLCLDYAELDYSTACNFLYLSLSAASTHALAALFYLFEGWLS